MTAEQHEGNRESTAERAVGIVGLRAEHDLTLRELADTLHELTRRTNIRERSKRAVCGAVARTQQRAKRVGPKPPQVLAVVTTFAASCAIAYAVTRMLRRQRRPGRCRRSDRWPGGVRPGRRRR